MPAPKPTNWANGRYVAVAERIAAVAEEVVMAVDHRTPLAEAEVVDLACGTGSAALSAVAAGANVTGVDITPELLEIAKTRPGGEQVTWVAADAAHTGLPHGGFDAAVSNMGIIFVEPTSLVAEVARLLRPGAVFGFSSWVRDDTENPFFTPIVAVLGPPPPTDYTHDQWGDRDIVAQRLAADFDDLVVETSSLTWNFASLGAALAFLENESPAHVNLFQSLDGPDRDRLRAAFETALSRHVEGTGAVSFSSPYLVTTAVRR
ncbi:class I SAM-dependent methyltransferase [Mycolicibacterium goodii]|uniref:class I SAM-dependent methyltransferase n=1 Tax=Mycolicibacterium goodii TaxID=134601 RepID=UPI001BDCE556|nr:class I SAM-dependent methyltransferase [Mycolicibacterium goodii]MBU8815488.1 class I SAM-dependent methyltransferase [Mycolicibacterium goodii]